MQDEVYSLRCRRRKSSVYLMNTTNMKHTTLNEKNPSSSSIYQYIKMTITQHIVYILGIFNLLLAAIAIICVTQAEVHPEYFSLVYIAISIFIFYMSTIIFIIILQITETYREHYNKTQSSLSVEIPLLIPQIKIQSNPVLIQNLPTKSNTQTRLLRSQTLPLPLPLNYQLPLSTIPSSPTLKDFETIRTELLPKYPQSLRKNYQSFTSTIHDHFYPPYRDIPPNDTYPTLIKPIPFNYTQDNDSHKSKVKFLGY
ncbi:hypothetical protein I4U23_008300 [Adineta vaga]|nr:hypothetical protein I4U23_008300 [Adineta vaga]